jgi:hypothetical protein
MNPKQANVQTLTRLDALQAELKAASEAQSITVDDIKNTIHQIMEILIDVAEAMPVIMADIKALADLIAKMTSAATPEPPAATSKVPASQAGKAAKK